jgi:hypothetical protein
VNLRAFFQQGTPESMARLVAFLYAITAVLLALSIGVVAIREPNGEHTAGIIAALGVPFAAVVGGSWSSLQSRVKGPATTSAADRHDASAVAREASHGVGAAEASD